MTIYRNIEYFLQTRLYKIQKKIHILYILFAQFKKNVLSLHRNSKKNKYLINRKKATYSLYQE